jgi:sugar lactone lactonase YvrE
MGGEQAVMIRRIVLSILLLLAPAVSVRADGPIAHQGMLSVIGRGAGSPDDLAVGADDTIYFGDMTANRVLRLNALGEPEIVSPAIREPEGIVPLPDGTLIVAEQATNRLYQVDPVKKSMTLFYAVGNKTHNDGIDGISRDSVTGDLLIPDAPTGRILRLSSDARHVSLIARGFKRPTSAALAADGTLFVCDEFGNAIYRITSDGVRTLIAPITLPDDVLLDGNGDLIVNALPGTIWRIDPQSGQKIALVTGLRYPHGIAFDSQGNLIIADAILNQIYRLAFPRS